MVYSIIIIQTNAIIIPVWSNFALEVSPWELLCFFFLLISLGDRLTYQGYNKWHHDVSFLGHDIDYRHIEIVLVISKSNASTFILPGKAYNYPCPTTELRA